MKVSYRIACVIAACFVLGLLVAGCGSGGGGTATKGGTLTMLSNGDVDDKLDPGYSYYQLDFIYTNATQRGVLGFKPDDTLKSSPDFAASYPTLSDGGKTITVKLKKGIKFSPPVNREATSADVKYAIERDFLPQVGNGYANSYWADIKGLKPYTSGKAKAISGITTPDKSTVVIKLSRPTGATALQALGLPGPAPVPKECAQKFDKGKQSTYGQHVVFTGPYMVQNDPKTGKITGYQPGHNITLVRNPNWTKSTDFRPAKLDKIVVSEGNDITVGNRKILQGQSMVGNQADLQASPAILKQPSASFKSQLIPGPFTGRFRYVAMNTTIKPFDNINVRKAVIAGMDKNALRLAFGGPAIGAIPTHFLSPSIDGFDQGGGMNGPNLDFMHTPGGNPQLAASYMKKG